MTDGLADNTGSGTVSEYLSQEELSTQGFSAQAFVTKTWDVSRFKIVGSAPAHRPIVLDHAGQAFMIHPDGDLTIYVGSQA